MPVIDANAYVVRAASHTTPLCPVVTPSSQAGASGPRSRRLLGSRVTCLTPGLFGGSLLPVPGMEVLVHLLGRVWFVRHGHGGSLRKPGLFFRVRVRSHRRASGFF